MSRYIKLEDAIKAITDSCKDRCLDCEFYWNDECAINDILSDLPTIEVSEDAISREYVKGINRGKGQTMSDRLLKESDVLRIAFQLPLVVNSAFADAVKALPSADRPQGEWIRTGRTNIYGGIEVQCSNCGDKVMVRHLEDEWYCRHCGADMGMKGANDESVDSN